MERLGERSAALSVNTDAVAQVGLRVRERIGPERLGPLHRMPGTLGLERLHLLSKAALIE